MMRGPSYVAALTAVYCLALGRAHVADLLTGAVAAAVLVLAHRGHVLPASDPRRGSRSLARDLRHTAARLWAAPCFVLVALADITRGTWHMAGMVLGLGRAKGPGLVEVPIGDRSQTGIVVTAVVSTLAPGSVLVDIVMPPQMPGEAPAGMPAGPPSGPAPGIMLFHMASLDSADAVRDEYERRYQEVQRKVFP